LSYLDGFEFIHEHECNFGIVFNYNLVNPKSYSTVIMLQRSYIEYPPEAERPPSPEELREMAREMARKRNSA